MGQYQGAYGGVGVWVETQLVTLVAGKLEFSEGPRAHPGPLVGAHKCQVLWSAIGGVCFVSLCAHSVISHCMILDSCSDYLGEAIVLVSIGYRFALLWLTLEELALMV